MDKKLKVICGCLEISANEKKDLQSHIDRVCAVNELSYEDVTKIFPKYLPDFDVACCKLGVYLENFWCVSPGKLKAVLKEGPRFVYGKKFFNDLYDYYIKELNLIHRSKWVVDIKGDKNLGKYEMSIVREYNQHGIQSYGWFNDNKILISSNNDSNNHLDDLLEHLWDTQVKLTYDICDKMNKKEGWLN